MELELEATVTPDSIKSLYAGESRPALLASLDTGIIAGKTSYSPNLLLYPIWLIKPGLFSQNVPDYLRRHLGEEAYTAFTKLVEDAEATRNELNDAVVSGIAIDSPELEDLVGEEYEELRGFAEYYPLIRDVDTTKMGKSDSAYFNFGLTGVAMVIIYANHMYGPETRAEFLRHVNRGVLEESYQQELLRKHQVNYDVSS